MARSPKSPQRTKHLSCAPMQIGLTLVGIILLLVALGLAVRWQQAESTGSVSTVIEFPHLHGMGFSRDGQALIVAAHDGTRIFTQGSWQIPAAPAHDYMGYAPTDDGFYSSGHPAPGASLPNPLGIIKSTDGGQTLTSLSAVGERDFHVLGVGYTNHALYVFNPSATSQIPAGIAVSRDDGTTWSSAPVQGLSAPPNTIAVHPTDAQVVAFATDDGMWLSSDAGATVIRIPDTGTTTAATFSVADGRLWYGGQSLAVYGRTSQVSTPIELPEIARDQPMIAIAINPLDPNDVVVGTAARSIYRSRDGGRSWGTLVQAGRADASAP